MHFNTLKIEIKNKNEIDVLIIIRYMYITTPVQTEVYTCMSAYIYTTGVGMLFSLGEVANWSL